MLGKNKDGIIDSMIRINRQKMRSERAEGSMCSLNCHKMVNINKEQMTRGMISLIKRSKQPCGLLRLGDFWLNRAEKDSSRGYIIYELQAMAPNAFLLSICNKGIMVERRREEKMKRLAYKVA